MSIGTKRTAAFGPYRLDFRSAELQKFGTKVKIGEQTFQILRILIEAEGELVTRDEIHSHIWGSGVFVDFDHGLNSAIQRLRDALSDTAENPRWIETVPRRGYRFIGKVEWSEQNGKLGISTQTDGNGSRDSLAGLIVLSQKSPTLTASTLSAGFVETHEGHQPEQSGSGRWRWILLAAVSLAGMFLSTFLWRSPRQPNDPIDSVAVLPFAVDTANSNTEYLSDGITENLISTISKLPNVRVMARSAILRYKGKDVTPQAIGRDLHVRAVLSGRLIQRADSLSLQAELADADKGFQLWSGQFTRDTDDVLGLQDDLSKAILARLQPGLTEEGKQRLAKRYTGNGQAYDLYLRGRYFWHKWTPEGYFKSVEYFQQAIGKDPSFALAYSGLADAYCAMARTDLPPWEAGPKAKSAAERAVALDNQLVQARISLAWVNMSYDWDWRAAEQNLRTALALDPSYPAAHDFYGAYFTAIGQHENAVAEGKRAVELDPASPSMIVIYGQRLYAAGRFEDSSQQYQKAIEMDPSLPDAHTGLAASYIGLRRYRDALSELHRVHNAPAVALSGYAHAMLHERPQGVQALNELRAMAKEKYVSPFFFAIVNMGLGNKDLAFQQLSQAREDHYALIPWVPTWPLFESLHSDARFASLTQTMGLAPGR